MFYRTMDMGTGDDVEKIRKMEEELFLTFVKKEVEDEQGTWVGSVSNNRLADMKVAGIVKTSFKNSRTFKKECAPSYFVKKKV